jgi:hypothetical protein
LYAFLAHRGQLGNFYIRSNVYKNVLGLGTWWSDSKSKQSVELQVDPTLSKVGLFGQPVALRYGLSYQLCPTFLLSYQVIASKDILLRKKVEVPVSKAVKATITSEVNLNDFYEQKNSIKALGFTLEVKL